VKTFATVAELIDSAEYKAAKAFTCNMPFSEYRKAPGFSQSGVNDFLHSPAYYKAKQDNPTEETPAMILGSYFDAILTKDGIEGFAVNAFDGRTKEGKAAKAEYEAKGVRLVSIDDHLDVTRWADSLLKNASANWWIKNAQPQVCGFAWINDIPVKGRADLFAPDVPACADLKLMADASPEWFAKNVANFDMQAAMYQQIFGRALGLDDVTNLDFYFICQEKHDFPANPNFTGVYEISKADLISAHALLMRTLRFMASAEESQMYTGYGEQVITARWAR
jgi:hypothetical protein